MPWHRRWIQYFKGKRNGEIKLSKEAHITLLIHGCFQVGASMSALFLNLYLWRLTEDLRVNGLFNMIMYAMTPLAFAVGGWIAKKRDRMVAYRMGIVMIAAFFLSVIVSGRYVAVYYPLFGAFYGWALGFYWVGYIVLMYDVTDVRSRAKFLATNIIVFNFAGLVGPALSGYLIGQFAGLRGYIVTFSIACCLFAAASMFSMRIRPIGSNRRAYYFKFSLLMMKRDPVWVRALFSFFFLGLFQGIMLFLPNILLYQTIGREDWVGFLAVLFALLTILTGFVLSRRADRSNVRGELLVSASSVIAASCLLLADVSAWSVIGYMMVFSLFNPVTVNTLTSYYYGLMDGLPLKGNFRIESVVLREFFLNAGRVLSILLLIVLAGGPSSAMLPYVLVGTALLQYVMIAFVKRKTS